MFLSTEMKDKLHLTAEGIKKDEIFFSYHFKKKTEADSESLPTLSF